MFFLKPFIPFQQLEECYGFYYQDNQNRKIYLQQKKVSPINHYYLHLQNIHFAKETKEPILLPDGIIQLEGIVDRIYRFRAPRDRQSFLIVSHLDLAGGQFHIDINGPVFFEQVDNSEWKLTKIRIGANAIGLPNRSYPKGFQIGATLEGVNHYRFYEEMNAMHHGLMLTYQPFYKRPMFDFCDSSIEQDQLKQFMISKKKER